MGEPQYWRTLQNRRNSGWSPESLQPVVPGVLERAARALHRRRRAQHAWEQVASSEWMAVAEVESVENGVVVVAVRSMARYHELCRQTDSLGRQLAAVAPGLCRVRFVPIAGSRQTAATGGARRPD